MDSALPIWFMHNVFFLQPQLCFHSILFSEHARVFFLNIQVHEVDSTLKMTATYIQSLNNEWSICWKKMA